MTATEPSLPDAVRLEIYRHFAETGRAPAVSDIAEATDRDTAEIEQTTEDEFVYVGSPAGEEAKSICSGSWT